MNKYWDLRGLNGQQKTILSLLRSSIIRNERMKIKTEDDSFHAEYFVIYTHGIELNKYEGFTEFKNSREIFNNFGVNCYYKKANE